MRIVHELLPDRPIDDLSKSSFRALHEAAEDLRIDYFVGGATAGNQDRLYEQEQALLETFEFDTDLAGAALLGMDAARLARGSKEVLGQLSTILDDEIRYGLLLEHMTFGDRQAMRDGFADPGRVRDRMAAFRGELQRGVSDPSE